MRHLRRAATFVPAIGLALTLGAAPPAPPHPEPAAARIRLVSAPEGNEVRYRVREQLARINFPSDAVGATKEISGAIVIGDDGRVVAAESRFVVNAHTLTSDEERRDNFIRRRTLETEQHPTIELVPTEVRGLPRGLPASGPLSFQLLADLTIRGVTRATAWHVSATAGGGAYTGSASTRFTFDDFQLTKPRVASVLSVADTITLEYDFRLVPEPERR